MKLMTEPQDMNEDSLFAFELEKQLHALSQSSDADAPKDEQALEIPIQDRVKKSKPVLDLLHEFRDQKNLLGDSPVGDGGDIIDAEVDTYRERSTVDIRGQTKKKRTKTIPDIEQLGRFRIEKEIGRGGFGIVVLAYDTGLDRKVAIKIPRIESALSKEVQERFVREARAAAVLSHPGIVAVHEVGHDQGVNFIVNQYVDGVTLSEWLGENQQVKPRQSASVVANLAEAMQHAHQRRVLHRDLKPSNILVEHTTNEADQLSIANRCRIADFGLAAIMDQVDDLTRSGSVVGTPAYMSPEQASGKTVGFGPATDVYGLGVILYQMLTGRPPFDGKDLLDVIAKVRTQDPVEPIRWRPEIPCDLSAICMKCLEKEPAARYSSAFELQKDLQRFLDGEPVLARPVSAWTKLVRWIQRYPQTATMLGAIIALLTLLAMGATGAALMLSDSKQDVLDHLAREIEAKDAATQSEELAIRTLYEARLSEAEALINSRTQGQRQRSLSSIKSAASCLDRLKLGADEQERLRSAIVDCSSLIDVEEGQRLDIAAHNSLTIEHDRNSDLYAFTTPDNLVEVRSATDKQYLVELKTDDRFYLRPFLIFGRDSKHLAMLHKVHRGNGPKVKLVVWNLESGGKVKATFDALRTDKPSIDFSYDGEQLAFVTPDRSIALVDLGTLKITSRFNVATTPTVIRFANKSNLLAVYRRHSIDLIDVTKIDKNGKGNVIGVIDCPTLVNHMEFNAQDQKLAAAGEDGLGYVWTLKDLKLNINLNRHGGRVNRVYFHPSGRFISTTGYDSIYRIWDSNFGELLLTSNKSSFGQFSTDGYWLESGRLRQKFIEGAEHQVFRLQEAGTDRIDVHNNNRLMLVNDGGGFELFDLQDHVRVASQPIQSSQYAFAPDGKNMFVAATFGLYKLPIQRQVSDQLEKVTIGPPEKLSGQHMYGYVSTSSDGEKVGVAVRYPPSKRTAVIFDSGQKIIKQLKPYPRNARWSDMTANGRFLATGTWHGRNVQIWDTETCEPTKTIELKNSQVCFSPDDSLLAMDDGFQVKVLDTKSWEPVCEPIATQKSAPMPIAFMPNHDILAIAKTKGQVQFINLDTGQSMVSFALSQNQSIHSLAFSPDGSRFVVGTSANELHVWKLSLLSNLFKTSGLPWKYDVGEQTANWLPIEVEFKMEELINHSQTAAIESVLLRDSQISETRDQASESIPLSQAIDNYVFAMGEIDLSSTPQEFVAAFNTHRRAWQESIRFFEAHDDMRGEMHDLFEKIRSATDDDKQELESLEKQIWDSWNALKEIARKYSPDSSAEDGETK